MNINLITKDNRQEIFIEKEGISKSIYYFEGAKKNNFCNYVYDDNYIIIYHDRRDLEGYHYLDVRSVYDINKDEIMNLCQGTYTRLKNMYIKKTSFNIELVMSYLLNLPTLDTKGSKYFHDYMTSYNPSITKDMVRNEVIKQYPIIEKYLNPLIYIFNKNKLINELKGSFVDLYAVKQNIESLDSIERKKKEELDKKLIYRK